MKKKDWVLAGGILFVAIVWLFVRTLLPDTENGKVVITIDGKVYGEYPLQEERTVDIEGKNVLVISDGKADMTDADCPDQICVHSVPITANGGSIVCLPNRVVLKIINADSSGSSHASRSTGTEGKNISSGQDTAGIHSSSGQGTDKNSSVSGQETDHSDSSTEDTDSEPSSPEIDTLAE